MGTKERKPAHRIRRINRGDPIRATFLNALADGVNEFLAAPAPAQSLKIRSDANQIQDIPDPSIGTEVTEDGVIVLEAVDWVTSSVRVFNEQDAEQWVDVERVEQVDLQLPDGNIWRLVFSPIWQ